MRIGRDVSFCFTISVIRARWAPKKSSSSFHISQPSGTFLLPRKIRRSRRCSFYKEALGIELPWLSEFVAAKAAKRLPVVLTTSEVRAMLSEMNGTTWLVAALIYVTGMRLLEALRLREKDVEFERREIIVRQGKGNKDRVTMLPENLVTPLKDQLAKAKRLHDKDLEAGFGEVFLPDAFARKSKGAARAWGWQYVFPSPVRSMDPRSERERRHHIYEESIQRAVRASH